MKEKFYKYCIVFALMCVPFSSWAYDFEVNGIYYLIEGNNATVTSSTTSGNSYSQSDIKIPTEITYGGTTFQVTKISKSAFRNCTNLKSIIIPSSVTSVESGAFDGCNYEV